jgi:4-amino-4-deoxy-L-arabinose transferase-like glycosyltransferase
MSAADLQAVLASPSNRSDAWRRDPGFWLVALVAGLLFFVRFHCPLQEPQEARYAEIPRQMLEEGSFLIPVLHGQPYLDKPPLFYWLVMASYSVFGVHDWAARLVACSAGFLCVLATYFWGRRLAGPRAALLAALILCLSPRFLQLERMLTMDGLLCLCVVSAWSLAYPSRPETFRRDWRERSLRSRLNWLLLSALACGLGLLTKGPVALVLVLVPLVVKRWLETPTGRIAWSWYAIYTAAAACIAAPWYVALAVRDPGFLQYFFWFHHVRRFVEPFDHAEPIWFYLPELLAGMLPWTLLVPGMIVYFARQRGSARAMLMSLATGGWCFVFFTLAGCKRASYLLPAYPAFAMALGCYLDALIPAGATAPASWLARVRRHPALACFATMAVLMLATVYWRLPEYARSYSYRGLVRRHAEAYEQSAVPIVCYPRRWDSVSFYLRRSDVRAYAADELTALIADVQSFREGLLFVKNGRPGASPSSELLARLPPSLVFVPLGRQGMLKVGRIVRREGQEPSQQTNTPEAHADHAYVSGR